MKRILFKILLLAISVVLLMGLVSCDISSIISGIIPGGDGTGDGTGDDETGGEPIPEGLLLIKNNVAQFQIVYSSECSGENVRAVLNFCEALRDLNIQVNDPIKDNDASKVTDCELIIGPNVRNRGEECAISTYSVGDKGYTMRVIGQKVVLAGGSSDYTNKALQNFQTFVLGISAGMTELPSKHFAIAPDYEYTVKTKYLLESIAFDGVDLAEYTLIYDIDALGAYNTGVLESFRENLFQASGYYLDLGTMENADSYDYKFIIRCSEIDPVANPDGFRAYFDGSDFIVECSYLNAFETAFEAYATNQFYNKTGSINLRAANYSYKNDVSVVYYSEFGAIGTDKKDDFDAIYATHKYANEGGQTVKGDPGATYYIAANTFTKSVPVKTDVDWNGATFIIDDTGSDAYNNRTLALFKMARDYDVVSYPTAEEITAAFGNVSIAKGDTSIPWLADVIKGIFDADETLDPERDEANDKCLVRIYNAGHRDYIRHGSNQNSGSVRNEVFIINKDGTLAEDCPIRFDYEALTGINIWRADDAPISVGNGMFYNICCRAVPETHYKVKYHSYNRGFTIERCNVTIHDVDHQMLDEPELGWVQNADILNETQDPNGGKGSGQESYPYNRGMYNISNTYNLLIKDCIITGHTTYYEPKSGTVSSGNENGMNYVAAGSYDYVVEYSTNIYFENVKQVNGRYHLEDGVIEEVSDPYPLEESTLWGIMSSNFAKNLFFTGCEVSRIDAHQGYWNVSLIDTVIGHTFHAVGGGDLYVENVHRITGNSFIVTRGDYGGTFEGDVVIKNCSMEGISGYSVAKGHSKPTTPSSTLYVLNPGYYASDSNGYWDWYFGYTCYMPITVTFIGTFDYPEASNLIFSSKDYTSYYMYMATDLERIQAENPAYEPYQVTEKIIYQDWLQDQIPICALAEDEKPSDNYMYSNIEVVVKSSEEESEGE